MPAIQVNSTRIPKIPGIGVTTLRVSVDRALTTAGGGAAGVVASGAIAVDAASFVLPPLTLYSTYNAPDALTQGATFRAELLDGLGNVVAALPGFEAFQLRIPSAQTTWNEVREHNDFIALIASSMLSNLGNDTNPILGQSIVSIIGAGSNANRDTISLFFGSAINPPGIRRNIATSQMEFSHDGLAWSPMGSGGGGGGGVTGNGTNQYIPMWTAGTVLGNSPIFYDAGNLLTINQNNFKVELVATIGLNSAFIFNGDPSRVNSAVQSTWQSKTGQTGDFLRLLDDTSTTRFRIKVDGSVCPRGVNYTWPAANGSGQLTNDGSGNLTWTPGGGGGSYSWLLAGDTGLAVAIPNGGDLRITGDNGLTSTFIQLTPSSFQIALNVDLLSTGGLQVSGVNAQLGIKLDSVTGGGNNSAQLGANGLYVPPASGGSGPIPTRAVTANTNLAPGTDGVLLIGTGGGAIAVSLVAPTAGQRRDFYFKKTTGDANAITLTPASGSIEGASNYLFSGANDSVHAVFDGTNWFVIGRA